MKKIIFFSILFLNFIFLSSCVAIKNFHKLPYEESIVFTEQEDLTSQFARSPQNYDRTGYVYHYIKSNQDDSFATDVWIYYPDQFHSESFKIYPVSKTQGFLDCICATYDEENFQLKEIDGKGVYKNGKIKSITTGSKDKFVRKTKIGKKEIVTNLGIIPCYDINFDLADLNSMIPFLKENDKDFAFGLTNIKRKSILGPVDILYLGKVSCTFEKQIVENGQNLNVFDIKLQNFEDLDGKIFINSQNNDVVEINTKLCGNPFFDSFKFKLIEKYKISSRAEWDEFMKTKARECL